MELVEKRLTKGPLTFRITDSVERTEDGQMTVECQLELEEVRLTQEQYDRMDADARAKYGPYVRIVASNEMPVVLKVDA